MQTRSGFIQYPVSAKNIKIYLEELKLLTRIDILEDIFFRNKRFKQIHALSSFFKWENYKDGEIVICGDQYELISIKNNKLYISEHRLYDIHKSVKSNSVRDKARILLTEIALYNSVARQNQFNTYQLSMETQHYFNNNIRDLIDKGISREAYSALIDEFELLNKIPEKDWQNFIYNNYRMLFPEFLHITKEKPLQTVDKDTKYVDFILKNNDTHLILEIKRSNAQIMSNSKDRNNFFFVSSVNKAFLQLARYCDSYANETFVKGKKENIIAVLLIGEIPHDISNDSKKRNDWNLARSMFKNVTLLTYRELLNKIKNLKKLLERH